MPMENLCCWVEQILMLKREREREREVSPSVCWPNGCRLLSGFPTLSYLNRQSCVPPSLDPSEDAPRLKGRSCFNPFMEEKNQHLHPCGWNANRQFTRILWTSQLHWSWHKIWKLKFYWSPNPIQSLEPWAMPTLHISPKNELYPCSQFWCVLYCLLNTLKSEDYLTLRSVCHQIILKIVKWNLVKIWSWHVENHHNYHRVHSE
jgi:hypothetical protein